VSRLSAAFCGVAIIFLSSAAMAQSKSDPSAWTAAIQIGLRHNFGGVRHGRSPSYALVEGMNKKVIVKINDVGPLMPGRIIDFNERTMRHFDPTRRLGLIRNVKVTALRGSDWTPGPVAEL
jgi:rare lipoprotein A